MPIGRVLRDVIARRSPTGSLGLQTVREACEKALPARIAGRVRLVAFKGGQATLEADSSALAYELHGFAGDDLLRRIQGQPGADVVKKLRFKVGGPRHGR